MISENGMEHNVEYLYRISSNYNLMTKSQRKIAKYLLENRKEMLSSSITLLAKKIGTTPSAITRFCQALNYKGFSELKFYMEKDLLLPLGNSEQLVESVDPTSIVIQKLMGISLSALTDTVMLLDKEVLEKVSAFVCQANRVHFYGEGSTGCTASMAYGLFQQIGIPCYAYNDPGFMRMATTTLQPGDVAFGITYSGEARNVVDAIGMARENGAYTVAITAKRASSLASACDASFIYSCNIPDDLSYFHAARICEIMIIGLLQSCILKRSENSAQKVESLRTAITKIRKNTRIK